MQLVEIDLCHFLEYPYYLSLCKFIIKELKKIEHLAIWVEDIELIRQFYIKYFDVTCGNIYINPTRGFTSYFLSFGEDKTRIEFMHISSIANPPSRGNLKGLAHFAISVGGKCAVDSLTERLRSDGYEVVGEPRMSGDGYYESVILDPEGNYVEILA